MEIYLEYAIIDTLVINCVLLWFVYRSVGHKLVWWKITAFVLIGATMSIVLPVISMACLVRFSPSNFMWAMWILMATKILITVLFLMVMSRLIKFLSHSAKLNKFVHEVTLGLKDKEYKFKGFLDTGNALSDPIEKLPIVVISLDLYMKMFPISNGRYVEFSTVGKNGKMLVFKPQFFKVNEKKFDVVVGVSMKNFGGAVKYDALLNARLM